MDFGIIHSIYTVVLFISFIGIVIWAYSKKRKSRFDEAANSIFADERPAPQDQKGVTKS